MQLIALHHLMEYCPIEDIECRYEMILMCRREHIGALLVSTGPAMMMLC